MTRVAIRAATHSTSGSAANTKAFTVAQMGDSITTGGNSTGIMPDRNLYGIAGQFIPTSIHAWAMLASQGKFTYGGTYATGGLTPATIRSTWLASVIAAKPDACVVLAGTNKGASLAQDIVDLTYMYTQLQANGITPILATLPPFGAPGTTLTDGSPTTIRNAWIRRYARTNGLPIVDYYAVLTDPVTGAYKTGYSSDGTHPLDVGCKAMGDALAAVILGVVGNHTPAPNLPIADAGNTDLLHPHPLMLTMSGTAPLDWSKMSGDTATNPAGPTGVVGNVLTVTRSTVDTHYKGTPVTHVAGHKYLCTFKIRATVTAGNTWTFRMEGTGYLWAFQGMSVTTGTDFSTVTIEYTAPPGLSDYSFFPRIYVAGAGTVIEIAQFGWRDLTANGLA